MTEIQGKSILVRVSEGSSYRESTVSSNTWNGYTSENQEERLFFQRDTDSEVQNAVFSKWNGWNTLRKWKLVQRFTFYLSLQFDDVTAKTMYVLFFARLTSYIMHVVGELPVHTVVTAEIMHDAEKASFIK